MSLSQPPSVIIRISTPESALLLRGSFTDKIWKGQLPLCSPNFKPMEELTPIASACM